MLINVVLLILVTVAVIYFAKKASDEKERQAEIKFKQVMVSLENNAKRDGTFKQSYFEGSDEKK